MSDEVDFINDTGTFSSSNKEELGSLIKTKKSIPERSNPIPSNSVMESDTIPTIHMITPTYARQSQKPDLTRLAQTLSLVPALHWIVVEDARSVSLWIKNLAREKRVNITLLAVRSKYGGTGRGVRQRNKALEWIVEHQVPRSDVIYFGDDDNTYDTRLFDTVSLVFMASGI